MTGYKHALFAGGGRQPLCGLSLLLLFKQDFTYSKWSLYSVRRCANISKEGWGRRLSQVKATSHLSFIFTQKHINSCFFATWGTHQLCCRLIIQEVKSCDLLVKFFCCCQRSPFSLPVPKTFGHGDKMPHRYWNRGISAFTYLIATYFIQSLFSPPAAANWQKYLTTFSINYEFTTLFLKESTDLDSTVSSLGIFFFT